MLTPVCHRAQVALSLRKSTQARTKQTRVRFRRTRRVPQDGIGNFSFTYFSRSTASIPAAPASEQGSRSHCEFCGSKLFQHRHTCVSICSGNWTRTSPETGRSHCTGKIWEGAAGRAGTHTTREITLPSCTDIDNPSAGRRSL